MDNEFNIGDKVVTMVGMFGTIIGKDGGFDGQDYEVKDDNSDYIGWYSKIDIRHAAE